MKEMVRDIFQKVLLAQNHRLVHLDPQSSEILQIITLNDIFKFYLRKEINSDFPDH